MHVDESMYQDMGFRLFDVTQQKGDVPSVGHQYVPSPEFEGGPEGPGTRFKFVRADEGQVGRRLQGMHDPSPWVEGSYARVEEAVFTYRAKAGADVVTYIMLPKHETQVCRAYQNLRDKAR